MPKALNFDDSGDIMKDAVTDPLMKEMRSLKDSVERNTDEKDEEIRGLKREIKELKEVLSRVVEGKLLELAKEEKLKRLEKKKVIKRENQKKVTIEKVLECMEKADNSRSGYRVKIGILLMYLTGMRVGTLIGLNMMWFEGNVMNNEGEELRYVPLKQRGENKELLVNIGRDNVL